MIYNITPELDEDLDQAIIEIGKMLGEIAKKHNTSVLYPILRVIRVLETASVKLMLYKGGE